MKNWGSERLKQLVSSAKLANGTNLDQMLEIYMEEAGILISRSLV